MRLLARSLLGLITLLIGPWIVLMALLRPRWRRGLGQRLFAPARRLDRPIWVHMASVGEAAAAQALVEAIIGDERGIPLHLTSQTWSGLEELGALHADTPHRLVPVDHPWCTRRALRRVSPRVLVLVEAEIWPSLVAEARRLGVPVVVVSGRISSRSFVRRRELDLLGFGRRGFARLSAIGARSDEDAKHFVALGCDEARVSVTGDLKWAKPAARRVLAPELAAWMSRRQTIIFGSTHPGEDEDFARAIDVVRRVGRRTGVQVQWLWAPRRVEDAEHVLRRMAGAEIASARRTGLSVGRPETAEVLVLDTLGELAGAWPHAVLAVVGGTFDETGGHDLLEPVHAGRPVLFGPNVHGVEVTARALVDHAAAVQVDSGEALGEQILLLLDSARERADRATRATALMEQSRMALEANLRLVLDHATSRPARAPEPDANSSERVREVLDSIPDRPGGLYAREGPTRSRWRASLLAGASALYGVGVRLDRWVAHPRELPCAVVSVGSLVAGGAGKTPAAAWVATALAARGHRAVLVTRGHGVKLASKVVVASHGAGSCASARLVGDEAVVLARRAPGVPVLASRDRTLAGLRAVSEFGCDVLVLDDGFAHHRLKRDLDLVCLDGRVGLGNGRMLPAGPLREPASALGRADAVVVIDGPLSAEDAECIEHHAPLARRFTASRTPRRWVSLRSGETREPNGLAGRTAALLAGVAEPSGFRALVARLGIEVTAARLRPDHHAYSRREIAALGRIAKLWVTTEKDAVKIDPAWWPADVEVWVLEIEFVPEDADALARHLAGGCASSLASRTGAGAAPSPASS